MFICIGVAYHWLIISSFLIDSVRNGRSPSKTSGCLKDLSRDLSSGCLKDLSSTPETVWLISPSNQAKQLEKIYLKTTFPIKNLTNRIIDETSLGKWRCNTCGKIENSCYLLQLHNPIHEFLLPLIE